MLRITQKLPHWNNHPDANLLAAFAERRLAPAERAALLLHVADCDACRLSLALTARTINHDATFERPAPSALSSAIRRWTAPLAAVACSLLLLAQVHDGLWSCGANTRVCSIETGLDAYVQPNTLSHDMRRHEWRRGTQECMRHVEALNSCEECALANGHTSGRLRAGRPRLLHRKSFLGSIPKETRISVATPIPPLFMPPGQAAAPAVRTLYSSVSLSPQLLDATFSSDSVAAPAPPWKATPLYNRKAFQTLAATALYQPVNFDVTLVRGVGIPGLNSTAR